MCSRYFGLVLVFVLIAAFMSRISCEQVEQITSEIDANDNNIENEIGKKTYYNSRFFRSVM